MEGINVKSVSDFITTITDTIKTDKQSDEVYSRNEYLFRGQSNEKYSLVPSLGRLGSGHSDIYFVERNMISMARRKLPSVFTNDLQPLELLGLLQHYGIPTRLLDITENALVALYFACIENHDKNGEVFIFKNDKRDVSDYPIDYAIAESYKYARPSSWSLKLFYKEVINQPYFGEQRTLFEEKDEKAGALWVEQCCQKPIFTYAPLRSARQQMQSGRYIIFPNKINHVSDTEPGTFLSRIQPMDKNEECIIGRIVIPSEYKQNMLREMDILGISRGNMFADSIDVVCQEIKEEFFVGM